MKYKTLLEAFKLNEAIQVEGAILVGTRNGYDVFNMTTFAACQEFVDENNTRAGSKWVHNENTFNQHVNENTPLYFIVRENTNVVVVGAILSNDNNMISCEDGGSMTANLIIEDSQGSSTLPSMDVPIDLIPNVHIQHTNEEEHAEGELENEDEEGWTIEEQPDPEENAQEQPLQEQPLQEEPVQEVEPPVQNNDSARKKRVDNYYYYDERGDIYDRVSGRRYDPFEVNDDDRYNFDPNAVRCKYKEVGDEAKLIWVSRNTKSTLRVADAYNGKPVTTIAPFAFYNNDNVKTIYMNNLKLIEKDAFAGTSDHSYYFYLSHPDKVVCKDSTIKRLQHDDKVYFTISY